MKYNYALLFAAITLLFSSCKKEEEPDLVNSWKLIEVLADPGDGSGTFQPVTSDKVVSFYTDGTVTSNASICTMETQVGTSSTGTYSTVDSTIAVDDCVINGFPLTFEMSGSNLILNYPCIEPCREKYELQQ